MNETVQTKIFIGFTFTGEIKTAFNQNTQWKKDGLFQDQKIIVTQFQNREYIGFYVQFPCTHSQLRDKEHELKSLVKSYGPKLVLDTHKIYLFPQIFLA